MSTIIKCLLYMFIFSSQRILTLSYVNVIVSRVKKLITEMKRKLA